MAILKVCTRTASERKVRTPHLSGQRGRNASHSPLSLPGTSTSPNAPASVRNSATNARHRKVRTQKHPKRAHDAANIGDKSREEQITSRSNEMHECNSGEKFRREKAEKYAPQSRM